MIIFKNYGLKDWLEIGEKRFVGDWGKKIGWRLEEKRLVGDWGKKIGWRLEKEDWLEKIEEKRLKKKDWLEKDWLEIGGKI